MRLNKNLILKNKILETIINKIEKNFSKDISIFVCYGSYITGEYKEFSDIDFFFIPKTDKGCKLSYQFIINGIGYDLFPVSWDRARKIANLDEQITSMIMDSKILFYSTKEDLRDYKNLKKLIVDNFQNKNLLFEKIKKILDDSKAIFFDLEKGNSETNINRIYGILEKLMFALALLNGKYLLKGIKNIKNEIMNFSNVPENFYNNYCELIKFENNKIAKVILSDMINEVERLAAVKFVGSMCLKNPNELAGFYEEFKSIYNKFILACESEDYPLTVYCAFLISRETDSLLKQYAGDGYFPEMTDCLVSKNYKKLKNSCLEHERLLLELLKKNRIPINNYPDISSFEQKFK